MHIKSTLIKPSGLRKKKKKNKDRACGEEIFPKEWKNTGEGNGLILTIHI
jgi:hypothetical protein